MKNAIKFSVLFSYILLLFSFTSCEKNQDVDSVIQLSEQEQATLVYMYEEEKMARDVYSYLNGLYNMNVFENISGSEQKHMNFVLEILTKYEISINVPEEKGVFANVDIQDLYNSLTEKGSQSLIDGLEAGATIEDVDIFDLMNAIEGTDKKDIIEMYELLTCGSRNHMRAFTGQLKDREASYSPQYISHDLYNSILAYGHESCGH